MLNKKAKPASATNKNATTVSTNLIQKLSIFVFAIVLTFAFNNEMKAQCPPPPDFINISFVYGGTITIEYPVGSGCEVIFEYCYRIAGGFYDAWINILGTTCDPGSIFNPDFYRDLITGCLSYIVMFVDPWQNLPGYTPQVIPPCPRQSQTYWRLGHASCKSGWYKSIIQLPGQPGGILVWKTADCNIFPMRNICWNTVRYCYEYIAPGVRALRIASYDPGLPSVFICPPMYTPTDSYPPGVPIQVPCIRACD